MMTMKHEHLFLKAFTKGEGESKGQQETQIATSLMCATPQSGPGKSPKIACRDINFQNKSRINMRVMIFAFVFFGHILSRLAF